MYQLWGKCFGIVRNSQTNTPDDKNCNWKSDDSNMVVAEIANHPLILSALKVYFNYKNLQSKTIMTKTLSSNTLDGFATSGSGTFYAFAYESDSWVCSCLFTI